MNILMIDGSFFRRRFGAIILVLFATCMGCRADGAGEPGEEADKARQPARVLTTDAFKRYIEHFNEMENENVVNLIPNARAWEWMKKNVPAFECPDKDFEEIYWYRWWTYRKHIRQFPDSIALTEFLTYKKPV